MQVLSPELDLNAFYGRIASAAERVLLLDYDGTLAPFRIRPEQAAPYPGIVEVLIALKAGARNRVVIVSGRRAEEVAALLPPAARPEIWGAHGWERRLPDGGMQTAEPPPEVRRALRDAHARACEIRKAGARIECKPASIALHWRGLPVLTVARLRDQTDAAWRPLVESGALDWLSFDGGVEVRARGANKGDAVDAVLAETGAGAAVAYLGDDLTDEDAFRAVKGRGLAVLVRAECRETIADIWLRPPHELLDFLGRWRENGARQ